MCCAGGESLARNILEVTRYVSSVHLKVKEYMVTGAVSPTEELNKKVIFLLLQEQESVLYTIGFLFYKVE